MIGEDKREGNFVHQEPPLPQLRARRVVNHNEISTTSALPHLVSFDLSQFANSEIYIGKPFDFHDTTEPANAITNATCYLLGRGQETRHVVHQTECNAGDGIGQDVPTIAVDHAIDVGVTVVYSSMNVSLDVASRGCRIDSKTGVYTILYQLVGIASQNRDQVGGKQAS